jgi:hypothetical protein
MSCPKCEHPELFTAVYLDRPVRWELCLECQFSRLVDEVSENDGGLGRTADGCMDGVQVYPYCLKTLGPSTSQPPAGNSNRMVGLLRTPPKGVM